MRTLFVATAVILFCLIMVPGASHAYEWDKQQYELGVKIGTIFAGEVWIDPPDRSFDTDSGTMFALRADSVVTPKMSMGMFIHQITNSTGGGDDITTTGIGATLKLRLTASPDLQIRPGVLFGYNFSIGSEAFKEDATGMEVGAFVEAAYHLQDGHMLTGELGFVAQPVGGNSDIDMTYGPTVYFLIGYAFGK